MDGMDGDGVVDFEGLFQIGAALLPKRQLNLGENGALILSFPEKVTHVVEPGDHVLVGPDDPPRVAKFEKGFVHKGTKRQRRSGGGSGIFFRARWFYRFDEIQGSVLNSVIAGKYELFDSDYETDASAELIVGKCAVLNFRDYRLLSGNENELLYFCRFQYRHESAQLEDAGTDLQKLDAPAPLGGGRRKRARASSGAATPPPAVERTDNVLPSDGEEEPPVSVPLDESSEEPEDSDESGPAPPEPVSTTKQPGKRTRRAQYQFSLPEAPAAALYGREKESRAVVDFVETFMNDATNGSRCLYISGVPGTGKTATVLGALEEVRANKPSKGPNQLKVVEANGMAMTDCTAVYSLLLEEVSARRGFAPMTACAMLHRSFSHGRKGRPSVVLVLDEMDLMVSRRQRVLYDLFEWSTVRNSRLAIIAIANTMDLPERVLPRIASRLGVNRLTFAPYTSAQLQVILTRSVIPALLPEAAAADKFDVHAVELCARKVAAVSGDVRRAREICKRSLAHADGQRVTPTHINDAALELSGSYVNVLENLSEAERHIVRAAGALVRDHGSDIAIRVLRGRVRDEQGIPSPAYHAALMQLLASNLLSRLDSSTLNLNLPLTDALA